MKSAHSKGRLIALVLFIFGFSISISAQTTAFTYQGRLSDASMPAGDGTYDFEFALFTASTEGTQLGATQRVSGVTLKGDSFAVQLDFGLMPFSLGAERLLEIRVKKSSDSSYTTLSPRHRITSSPYAIRALNAETATVANNATSATNAANAANADKLDNIDSSGFVQTNTTSFIRNQTTQQSANFNVSGTGQANIFEAKTQFNLNGTRVLGNAGQNNLFVGYNTGDSNTDGSFNAFVGTDAGYNNNSGSHNSFIGAAAGFKNSTGVLNSFFGSSAGEYNTTGSGNSFFGQLSGYLNTTGSNNTIIGNNANVGSNNLSYSTAIGSGAVVSTSNTIVLGRADGSDKVRVFGLGAAGTTHLCRNNDNEISTCAAPASLAEKSVVENVTEINALRDQIKQQQQEINELKSLVCSLKPDAATCRETKK